MFVTQEGGVTYLIYFLTKCHFIIMVNELLSLPVYSFKFYLTRSGLLSIDAFCIYSTPLHDLYQTSLSFVYSLSNKSVTGASIYLRSPTFIILI